MTIKNYIFSHTISKIPSIIFLILWICGLIVPKTYALESDAIRTPNNQIEKETVKKWLAASPVRFLENKGQMTDTDQKPVPSVLFKASAPGMDVYLTEKGLTYVFIKIEEEKEVLKTAGSIMEAGLQDEEKEEKIVEMSWVNLHLKGASIERENIIKEGVSAQDFNYFYPHCPDGIYGVKEYERITIKEVYPGIDWVLYGSSKTGMKYDFVVHPGANPDNIKLIYEGENPLQLDSEGNINIKTKLGEITEKAPYSYIHETGKEINSSFAKKIIDKYNVEISFQLSNFHLSQAATLIIDPQLVWATLYGGASTDGLGPSTCDANGNFYVTGYLAAAVGFPLQPLPGAYNQSSVGSLNETFILRFSNGGALNWATYYGGDGGELGRSIACDANGNVYITGNTSSTNFPTRFLAGAYNQADLNGTQDAFILRFTNTGVRTWATYYGGSRGDNGRSIAFDVNNNIYVTGSTGSSDFPLKFKVGAYNQSELNNGLNANNSDAFILRFLNTGELNWATYYGGNGSEDQNSIALDDNGNVYVTGITLSTIFPTQFLAGAYNKNTYTGSNDIFISRFTSTGALSWSTYYGGGAADNPTSIACDGRGNVYVLGRTSSTDFPTYLRTGAYNQDEINSDPDCFILRFADTGSLTWSTYYGGLGSEQSHNIQIDPCGNVYISLYTSSPDLITLAGGNCGPEYLNTDLKGQDDNYLIKFSDIGTISWATYFGGNGQDGFGSTIALDNDGNLFISGEWMQISGAPGISSTYPFTNPGAGAHYDTIHGGSDDGYIAKFAPIPITISQSQVNSTKCNPCNGSATAIVSCGTSTYLWNTGDVTSSITGLCPGSYSVIVTDESCYAPKVDTLYFDILQDNTPSTVTFTAINPSCNGDSDGSVTVNTAGSAPPFTYLWSSGGTGATENNLPAGTYTVTVTDTNGCTATQTVTLTEPLPLTATTSFTPATCGNNNGTATVSPSGGTGPYTYSWDPAGTAGDTLTATNLAPGTYTCTVTDLNGCFASFSITVPGFPSPVVTTGTITHVSCNGGNNGAASVDVSGVAPPFTYAWTPVGGNASTANGLSAGTYTCLVTDTNGCMVSNTVTITEPDALTGSVSSSAASCGNNDGSATVNPDAGTPPYAYSWFPGGQTTATASNLAAGSYICTVTDAAGCPKDFNVTVDNLNGFSGSIVSQNNVSCNGGNNGTATIAGSGGTPPYSYTWSAGQSSATATGLSAGYYSCTITDADNCTFLVSVAITEPEPLVLNTSSTPDVCRSSSGSASVVVSGGTSPYSYSWDASSAVDPDIFNLPAGNYSVTVTDNNGCTATASINVPAEGSLTLNIDKVTQSGCNGSCSGSVEVTANGTPPYSFDWNTSPPQSTANITGLCPGDYTLLATDADNCRDSITVTITENEPYTASFTADPKEGCAPLCVSFNNTTANTNIESWKFGDGQADSGAVVSHCYTEAGNYSITLDITDNFGCSETITVQNLIQVFPNPVANFNMNPSEGSSLTNALIRFTDESTGANHWLWDFGDPMNSQSSLQNPSFNYDFPGYYTIVLLATNGDNCTDTVSHTIYIEPEFAIYIPNAFTPDGDGLNDFFAPQGVEFTEFEMTIFNRWGEEIYKTSNIDKPWNGKHKNGNEIQKGVYVYKIWVKDLNEEIHYYVGNVTLIR